MRFLTSKHHLDTAVPLRSAISPSPCGLPVLLQFSFLPCAFRCQRYFCVRVRHLYVHWTWGSYWSSSRGFKGRVASPIRRCFTLRRGWCSQVKWYSHVGSLRRMRVQPLDFRPPLSFPSRTADLAFELFGPSIGPAILFFKFDFPTRLFFPAQDRMCLFVCLHANDAASVDHDDALSWVQPVAPSLEKNRAEQCNAASALLRISSHS